MVTAIEVTIANQSRASCEYFLSSQNTKDATTCNHEISQQINDHSCNVNCCGCNDPIIFFVVIENFNPESKVLLAL